MIMLHIYRASIGLIDLTSTFHVLTTQHMFGLDEHNELIIAVPLWWCTTYDLHTIYDAVRLTAINWVYFVI